MRAALATWAVWSWLSGHVNALRIVPAAPGTEQFKAAAALCVDQFVDLPLGQVQRPFAVNEWAEQLQVRSIGQKHELLIATYSSTVTSDVFGCVELGLLPPPPKTRPLQRGESGDNVDVHEDNDDQPLADVRPILSLALYA